MYHMIVGMAVCLYVCKGISHMNVEARGQPQVPFLSYHLSTFVSKKGGVMFCGVHTC